ncbi:MAG TPA: glycosyltransferase family 39 protein [Terriglobales bacterium]|nr:glycosyltransferase family 39 protein [Terriglobales bacterium]
MTARVLGGDRFAQVLASLSVLFAPVFLLPGNFLTTAFEPMWTVCAFLMIVILRGHRSKLWLAFGAAAGIGFLNKHSMAFWGVGLVLGLLLTARREFRSRWIWLGAGLALLIVLPNLWWEQQHHWVTLQALRQARDFNRLPFSFSNFWMSQVVLNGHASLPVWLAGLAFLLTSTDGRRYRAIGIAFVAVVAFLTLENGKSYYLSAAFPVILAGGAVQISEWLEKVPGRWLRPALLAGFAAWGFIWMPMALPLLSSANLVRY